MGTQSYVPAPMRPVAAAVLLLLSACSPLGGSNNVASRTPSASPSAASTATASAHPSASPSAPPAVTTPYGVLVGSQAATSYSVTLVGVDGHIAATAQATTPPVAGCGTNAAAPVPLPVSTSDSRVYFMDAQGAVHYLAPNGDTGKVTTVPAPTASRRSTFAVSPDDNYMAVAVADYSATGATTRLYMYLLNSSGTQTLLFSQTGARTLWPVGWHGTNNLVLAVVPSCTQGGGVFCCGMGELHVVDPATATRRFTLGAYGKCPIAGPPSPAGVVCTAGPGFTTATYLSWIGVTVKTLALNGPSASFVNPGGTMVAMVDGAGTSFTIGASTIPGMYACSWIDDTHVLSGGDAQHQPRIAEVVNGSIVPVSAEGDCGGRLPGGL